MSDASFTLAPGPFPAGTTVGVYLRTTYIGERGPAGAVIESAVVDAHSVAVFDGLGYLTEYWAAAQVAGIWRKVAFTTIPDPGSIPSTSADLEALAGRLWVNTKDSRWGPGGQYKHGAIGDGEDHLLDDFFGSLAAAQQVYPFAGSLGQQLDWAAAQKAIAYVAARTAGAARGGGIFHPYGEYVWGSSMQMVLMSSIWNAGEGKGASRIRCTAELDGSDSLTRNNLFNANNLQHITLATTNGSDHVTVVDGSQQGVAVGSIVFAAGVPNGAVVLSGLGTSTWVLSAAATATSAGVSAAVAIGVPGSYQHDLIWTGLTLDGYAQNPSGIPPEIRAGNNLCGIECQNVDNATAIDCEFLGWYGNAFVAPTIDPRKTAACVGPTIQRCDFTDCVRGLLPQYGIAGSVIQIGACVDGSVADNRFVRPGGPWVDYFNCVRLRVENNDVVGMSTTAKGPGQTVGEHSDFGNEDCVSDGNHSTDAGPIVLSGNMLPNAFNIVSTPGPQRCTIRDGQITRTGMYPLPSPPAIPASNVAVQPPAGYPLALRVHGGLNFGLKVNGVVQPGSGHDRNQYAIPGHVISADIVEGSATIGIVLINPGAVILNGNTVSGLGFLNGTTIVSGAGTSTWTLGAPSTWTGRVQLSVVAAVTPLFDSPPTSWEWFIAPALLFGLVTIVGGSYPGEPVGLARLNRIENMRLVEAPADGIYYSDATGTLELDNEIIDAGEWNYPSAAYFASDSAAVAGTGCTDNTYEGGAIRSTRPSAMLFTNYRDDSDASVGNRILGKRLEATVNEVVAGGTGKPILSQAAASAVTIRDCYGPGAPTGPLVAPTMPSSGVALRNPFGYDVVVQLDNAAGHITGVAVNGQSIGAGAATAPIVSIRLRAGEASNVSVAGSTYAVDTADSITVTRSGTVPWVWSVA